MKKAYIKQKNLRILSADLPVQNETRALMRCDGFVVYPDFITEDKGLYLCTGSVQIAGSRFYQIPVGQKLITWSSNPSEYQLLGQGSYIALPEAFRKNEIVWLMHAASALNVIRSAQLQPGDCVGIMGQSFFTELIKQISVISLYKVQPLETAKDLDVIIISGPVEGDLSLNSLRSGGRLIFTYPSHIRYDHRLAIKKELKTKYLNHIQSKNVTDIDPEDNHHFSYGYCRWSDFRNISLILKWIEERKLDFSGMNYGDISVSGKNKIDLSSHKEEAIWISW